MSKTVLMATSGGVDSAIGAMLLKQKGYSVAGIHFNLYESVNESQTQNDLQNLTNLLDVPIIEVNVMDEFKRGVINYFIKEYSSGRTPCPCSFCNLNIKWKYLFEYANENKFDYIATGHYARIVSQRGYYRVSKGMDKVKDQSYFLWKIPSEYLSKTIFPLGSYTKEEVKTYAREVGLGFLSQKKESMGVCFLKGKDYRDYIAQLNPSSNLNYGSIVNEKGKVIGKHNGIQNFTVGQKKGINNLPNGCCVVKIDSEKQEVTIGKSSNLNFNYLIINDFNLPGLKVGTYMGLKTMIRGFGWNPMGDCKLTIRPNNEAIVELSESVWAPMPGQATVLYQNDILLGGGYLLYAANRTRVSPKQILYPK